jgi:hypothetical protein
MHAVTACGRPVYEHDTTFGNAIGDRIFSKGQVYSIAGGEVTGRRYVGEVDVFERSTNARHWRRIARSTEYQGEGDCADDKGKRKQGKEHECFHILLFWSKFLLCAIAKTDKPKNTKPVIRHASIRMDILEVLASHLTCRLNSNYRQGECSSNSFRKQARIYP